MITSSARRLPIASQMNLPAYRIKITGHGKWVSIVMTEKVGSKDKVKRTWPQTIFNDRPEDRQYSRSCVVQAIAAMKMFTMGERLALIAGLNKVYPIPSRKDALKGHKEYLKRHARSVVIEPSYGDARPFVYQGDLSVSELLDMHTSKANQILRQSVTTDNTQP